MPDDDVKPLPRAAVPPPVAAVTRAIDGELIDDGRDLHPETLQPRARSAEVSPEPMPLAPDHDREES